MFKNDHEDTTVIPHTSKLRLASPYSLETPLHLFRWGPLISSYNGLAVTVLKYSSSTVFSKDENLIHDVKISTVGPGYVSGEGEVQELTAMDFAMKLHYIRTVYYFKSQAFEGLTIIDIKETMFYWMNHAYIPCGRLKKSESGRPYVKCNDCGVRLIEARCNLSLDEWLESSDDARHKLVVPSQVLGPDMLYSPLF